MVSSVQPSPGLAQWVRRTGLGLTWVSGQLVLKVLLVLLVLVLMLMLLQVQALLLVMVVQVLVLVVLVLVRALVAADVFCQQQQYRASSHQRSGWPSQHPPRCMARQVHQRQGQGAGAMSPQDLAALIPSAPTQPYQW
jgi:hypothetical protein